MLTIVFKKTIMRWIFPTTSNKVPVIITGFILTALNNNRRPCKNIRVGEDGYLEKLIDSTNILVY